MVHTRIRLLRHVVPFDLRIHERCRGLRSIAVEHLDGATHGVHVLPRHRLPPLLREALSGGAGLVEVEVVRDSPNLAVLPLVDGCVAQLKLTAAADKTALLNEHAPGDSIAEVVGLQNLKFPLLVRGEPVLQEAANCRLALKRAYAK